MASAISVENVGYAFRQGFWLKRRPVLKGVSLEVVEGSIFGLIGSNGSGKTTLIHLLTGVRSPDEGEVRLFGLEARSREARRMIGFLPERPYFHPFLTGREFLFRMAELSGVLDPRKAVERSLELAGLTTAAGRKLEGYSKGMLQRIGIAQAVLHDPRIVIMDEPMSGLDPLWRKQQRDLILRLSDGGKTVFFSSHLLDDVEYLCDGAACLSEGGVILRGEAGWPRAGIEIVVGGVAKQSIESQAWADVEVREERNGCRLLLAPGTPSGPVLEGLIRMGGQVRTVQPAPIHQESANGIS